MRQSGRASRKTFCSSYNRKRAPSTAKDDAGNYAHMLQTCYEVLKQKYKSNEFILDEAHR